ncbi:TonB-dependent siderophore receptor [Methyloprofundus sp.]|uniref:TonB-dependent siderophore receptor n=1 Tax=Methyloprofundus sp. TaxID=2020875 RepID=UPI003D1480DE
MYAEPLAGIEPASDSSTSGTISLGSEQLTPGGTVVFDTLLIEENSLAPMSYNVFDASSATKTDTPIMEIPQSIQVIPKAVLRDQDLQTLGSAVENVSSVVAPKTTELLTSEFIIRGFKSQFYTDSMPTYGQGNGADPLSLVNVERIEVVKGPTSTLFGGGLGAPTGGLINVVSKQPLPEAQYIVSFRGGSFTTLNPSFDINQPLTEDDTVLFRLTGEYEYSKSYIDALENENFSIFPTIAFNFSPATQLIIRGQYSHVKFLEYSGLRAEGTIADVPGPDPYTIPAYRYSGATDTPRSTVENAMVTAEFSHRFSSHVEASIQARYYQSTIDEFSSFTHTLIIDGVGDFGKPGPSYLPYFSGVLPATVHEFVINPNLVIDFDTGFMTDVTHKVLFGLEYDNTRSQAQLGVFYDELDDIWLNVADRHDDITYLGIKNGNISQAQDDRYQTIGVYLQDQMDISSRFHLLTSLRWTHVSVDEIGAKTTNSNVTPRVGAVFDMTDSISVFAGYGEGFRAVTALFGDTAEPEESSQVEGGVKFDFFQYGLSGSVAGYQLIRENVVVPDPDGAFSSIQAGEQMSYGAEIDFLWEPLESLSILGNYAYTHATLTEHPDPELGVGDRLPRVPEHSGRVAVRYRFLEGIFEGLGIGMGITAMSNREISLPNTYTVDGFYRMDMQASYPLTKHLDLTINIQNLTNTQYYEPFLFLQDEVVSPGPPISAFATLTAHF